MVEGTLVAIEGIDATGKTTLISHIANHLEQDGYDVTTVGEFSDTQFGRELHDKLVEGNTLNFDEQTMTLISKVIADHFYQMENEIRPALKEGYVVLADRYVDTLPVYEISHIEETYGKRAAAEGLFDAVEQLTVYMPDLTVLLTLPTPVHHQRIRDRGNGISPRDKHLYTRRDEHYHRRMANRDNTIIIETNNSEQQAMRDIMKVIRPILP